MRKPTVILIAGGQNSRFFPINTTTHKGFLPLLGKPLVVRTIEDLHEQGFWDIVLVVSPNDFQERGIEVELSNYQLAVQPKIVVQESAKGQGDAVLCAREHLTNDCILLSPYYTSAGVLAEKVWQAKQSGDSDCVFMGTKTENTSLYGMLAFDPQNHNRVVGVVEKPEDNPPSNFRINSVYYLTKEFVEVLAQTPISEYSLEEALSTYAVAHNCSWVENTDTLASIKYAWHLFDCLSVLFETAQNYISKSATISSTALIDSKQGPVIIDDGATIGDFVKIVGPCYVGKQALIGDYSFVRGSTVEADATIGAYTELVRSIVLPHVSMHSCYIADSIIGYNVKIGAGLITANKRFDRKEIQTQIKGKMVDTARKNLGTIIGSDTATGIGVKTMPGILIGSKQVIKPGEIVTRNIPHA